MNILVFCTTCCSAVFKDKRGGMLSWNKREGYTSNLTQTGTNAPIELQSRQKKNTNRSNLVNGEVTEYIITYQETEFKIRVLEILRIRCVMEQIHVNELICQRR